MAQHQERLRLVLQSRDELDTQNQILSERLESERRIEKTIAEPKQQILLLPEVCLMQVEDERSLLCRMGENMKETQAEMAEKAVLVRQVSSIMNERLQLQLEMLEADMGNENDREKWDALQQALGQKSKAIDSLQKRLIRENNNELLPMSTNKQDSQLERNAKPTRDISVPNQEARIASRVATPKAKQKQRSKSTCNTTPQLRKSLRKANQAIEALRLEQNKERQHFEHT